MFKIIVVWMLFLVVACLGILKALNKLNFEKVRFVLVSAFALFVIAVIVLNKLNIERVESDNYKSGIVKLDSFNTVDNLIADNMVNITCDGETIGTYTISQLGLKVEGIDNIKYSGFNLTVKDMKLSFDVSDFNSSIIRTMVKELNANRTDTIYAQIKDEDDTFKAIETEKGTKLDADLVANRVKTNITGVLTQEIDVSDLVIYDEKLDNYKECKDMVDRFYNCYVTYSNNESIKLSDFKSYYSIVNGKIAFTGDDELLKADIAEAVKKATDSYNTVGKDKEFTTHDGVEITIKGGTLGNVVDVDMEADKIFKAFKSLDTITARVPEYKQFFDDDYKTYIEVDLSKQHLWYYEDGVVKLETDVVSGKNNKTPTGAYYISEMINGKYLRGDDYVTWVNKWMRLTGNGIGLHDANWRSSFGGTIYKYSGSHGCINLPTKFAYTLYDTVKKNTVVMIYKSEDFAASEE